MIIDGFQKLTLLDYPNHVACIIFTRGCNFNCPYCQNSLLINHKNEEGLIKEDEVFEYLIKRKNILEGIVISGGEPTLQKNLKEFIIKIKALGYKIKLDTNGSNPKILKDLIDNSLIDYVAMDIKNNLNNYEKVIGCKTNINLIKESIDVIKKSNIDHEFRTTITKENHPIVNLKEIVKLIGNDKYYLQNFKESEGVIDKSLHGYTDKELINIRKSLDYAKENIKVRGITDYNLIQKEEEKYYV